MISTVRGSICEGTVTTFENSLFQFFDLKRQYSRNNCKIIKDLNAAGIYFLIGIQDISERPFVKLYASENVGFYLNRHYAFEEDNITWTHALITICYSKRATLEMYESILRYYLKEIDRHGAYDVLNYLPVREHNLCENELILKREAINYIDNILRVNNYNLICDISSWQHPDFSKNHVLSYEQTILFIVDMEKQPLASCVFVSTGILIFKGAILLPADKSLNKNVLKLRELNKRKIRNGHLIENVLIHDVTYAASFILGYNADGFINIVDSFHNPLGESLDDYKRTKEMTFDYH